MSGETSCAVKLTNTLLWVHQQQRQRELLTRYGSHISLIDATYRTMKYELPLLFVCVRTNVGYSVVAQFIVQSECISEALNVLKELNSNWNPPFFLCDFSDAEFSALKQAFPSTTVYGCDFHRDFTGNRHGHAGYKTGKMLWSGAMLTAYLICFVLAPGHHLDQVTPQLMSTTRRAVSVLKESAVWKNVRTG